LTSSLRKNNRSKKNTSTTKPKILHEMNESNQMEVTEVILWKGKEEIKSYSYRTPYKCSSVGSIRKCD
jgi:hypothetical protein